MGRRCEEGVGMVAACAGLSTGFSEVRGSTTDTNSGTDDGGVAVLSGLCVRETGALTEYLF